MTEHPITPPRELVSMWAGFSARHHSEGSVDYVLDLATKAAQWGADQELEACCEWLQDPDLNVDTYKLRAARRPKPPSLKEQALVALHAVAAGANDMREQRQDFETIRRALEALPE